MLMELVDKKQLVVMLKRIQGQVGGIEKMIVDDKGCAEVLTQISAAMSSLKSVGRGMIAEEAKSCNESEKAKAEFNRLLKRFL